MRILCLLSLILFIFEINCVPPSHMRSGNYRYSDSKREELVRTAERYLGVKYRYGGSNVFGFDCSGFVMHVYKKHGMDLPRSAGSQYRAGKKLRFEIAEPGDLVFFKIEGAKIDHVGIYTGNGRFIHSPSRGKKVSYASIENPYWKKRYTGAVTYFK